MSELGINADGRAAIQPASLAALGARWTRCVAYPDENIQRWIHECQTQGVRVLLVLAGESIGHDPASWADRIAYFRGLYGGLADAWQVGNESDHVSDSSWTMEPADLSQLLRVARFQLGPDEYIVGAGLASGNPDWAYQVDWSWCNAIACHPYAKNPGSPELNWLLAGYKEQYKPLWVTEYHARSLGMAAALRDDPRVQVALAFCFSDSMVPGFGLIEDRAALADFKTAAKESSQPANQQPAYQLGFAEWAAKDRALLGDPLENERGGIPGFSVQKTSTGRLMAQHLADPATKRMLGWKLTFWRDSDGARFLFANGRSEQIA